MNALATVSIRRHRTDKFMRWAFLAGLLLAFIPLVLVLLFVIIRGAGALSLSFFTTDPTGAFFGDQGGIKSAILGTLEIVGLAAAIAVPIGIALAVYLNEIGRKSRLASLVRYFVDVLTGVPSIVFGLFIYTVLVVSGLFGGFAAWKGSVALALLMLPVVTRASEVSLTLVPDNLREAALALGAPRWRMITSVVLPTALPGLLTGSLLAIARASGETAPLLFTVLGAQATTFSLGAQMNSLPLQIFNDVREPNPQLVTRAWGAALTLITIILLINIVARLAARRSNLR
ncbi:MAG TPA: phosphate ABC transporter permease PstA [Candidatus Dormibacteraeota bacterium]|nr:phosphate ABC transporter permease PstA [Candidatus Dormibacteraeota bacterium]